MTKLFESAQYVPKGGPRELIESPLGQLLNRRNLSYVVRAKDEVMVVTDSGGKEVEVEPYQYLYVRRDGTLHAEWDSVWDERAVL